MELGAYGQLDGVLREESEDEIDPATAGPRNGDRFVLRRARVRAEERRGIAELAGELGFDTMEGPRLQVREARLGLSLPAELLGSGETSIAIVRLGGGLFRTPFLLEVHEERDAARLFSERTLYARALVPGEVDVGAFVGADAGWVAVTLALLNGEPPGQRGGSPGLDPTSAKDLAARLQFRLAPAHGLRLAIGGSFLAGEGLHAGAPATKEALVWRDRNEDGLVQPSELAAIQPAAAEQSRRFSRSGLAGELRGELDLWPGTLTLAAELVAAENLDRGVRPADPIALGHDQRAFGAQFALVQALGRRARIGVRLARYAPSLDDTRLQRGALVRAEERFDELAIAAQLRLAEAPAPVALTLEVTHTEDTLALDAAGAPADLANDQLLVRLQVELP